VTQIMKTSLLGEACPPKERLEASPHSSGSHQYPWYSNSSIILEQKDRTTPG
jgi:hypothetical protein